MTCKVVAFVGKSSSGKTTLITNIIPKLKSRGVKVATIKHTHHNVKFDQPGKDSWKHRHAGAERVMLISGNEMAIFGGIEPTLTLEEIRDKWFSDFDLLIVEGFKNEPVFKIEIFRKDNKTSPLYSEPDFFIDGLITDTEAGLKVPTFGLNDYEEIAAWICKVLELKS